MRNEYSIDELNPKQYYRLRLWDYSVPAFISNSKSYYGTLDDIRAFMAALEGDAKISNDFRDTLSAFREYEAGNHRVTHNVAYQDIPLLEPVKVLSTVDLRMDAYNWEYTNTWGSAYAMKCGSVATQHLWISGPEGCSRAVKARFNNLQYLAFDNSWVSLTDGFWGHPKILEAEGSILCNRLAVVEKCFGNRKDAQKDLASFRTVRDVNFTGFCEDIFGDG